MPTILDLWSQFDIRDNGLTLQPSYTDYRDEFAREIRLKSVKWTDKSGVERNATKWHPKPGAPMRVHRIIKPRTIRFRTDECIDLPPVRFLVRDIEMTQMQRELYEDLERMLFAEFEGEGITAKVAALKMLKLREITGGFVFNDKGEEMPINKHTPKMIELDALLQQSIGRKLGDQGKPSKALVWAQYRWECKTLVDRYKRLYGARGLFGGISSGAKDTSISRFMNNDNCQLLICHPGSVGHGLTLTEANFAFYYSLSHNYEEFYQSYRRIVRPGQKRKVTYYFLIATDTIDEDLLLSMKRKKGLSDVVTDGKFQRNMVLDKRKMLDRSEQIEISWEDASETSPETGK